MENSNPKLGQRLRQRGEDYKQNGDFGGCWDCNWTRRLRRRFEISEKLWFLDEVVVEKKLMQILGSASGRNGRFQKLLLTCRTLITFLEFICLKDGTWRRDVVILKSVGDLGSNFNYKFQNLGSASGVDGSF